MTLTFYVILIGRVRRFHPQWSGISMILVQKDLVGFFNVRKFQQKLIEGGFRSLRYEWIKGASK